MTVPSYTEEDVEQLAKVICDGFDALPEDAHRPLPSVPIFAGTTYVPPEEPPCDICRTVAGGVLDNLTAAGRLVPPGSEIREEWGTRRWYRDELDGSEIVVEPHEVAARELVKWRISARTDLLRRLHIVTPWSPSVPDTKEGT